MKAKSFRMMTAAVAPNEGCHSHRAPLGPVEEDARMTTGRVSTSTEPRGPLALGSPTDNRVL